MNLDVKIPNKVLENWIQQGIKELHTMTKCALFQMCKTASTFGNQLKWSIIVTD